MNVKSIPHKVGPEDKAVLYIEIPHKACAGISTSDHLESSSIIVVYFHVQKLCAHVLYPTIYCCSYT